MPWLWATVMYYHGGLISFSVAKTCITVKFQASSHVERADEKYADGNQAGALADKGKIERKLMRFS